MGIIDFKRLISAYYALEARIFRGTLCFLVATAAFFPAVASTENGEVKIQTILPFEGDAKVLVEIVFRDCVHSTTKVTIFSEYTPINYSGRAIVLGNRGCPKSDWRLLGFSPFHLENVIFVENEIAILPAWATQVTSLKQLMTFCQLSICKTLDFDLTSEGALIGANIYHTKEEEFFKSKSVGEWPSKFSRFYGRLVFKQPLRLNNRHLFSAVGRVIVFDDGTCAVLGEETQKFTELKTLAICSK